jgi:hypothetical protein
MGYTVYFEISPVLDAEKFETFSEQVKQILGEAKVLGIKIVNGMGGVNTKPIVDKELISFNGEKEDSHETLFIQRVEDSSREKSDRLVFNFCKTARKPYDLIVKATLVMLKHNFPESIIEVDGTISDFDAAIKLCEKLFGPVEFKLK